MWLDGCALGTRFLPASDKEEIRGVRRKLDPSLNRNRGETGKELASLLH